MPDSDSVITKPREDREDDSSAGVKRIFVENQQRSTRDLEECVKADLLNSIDPELLRRLRRQANGEPSTETGPAE